MYLRIPNLDYKSIKIMKKYYKISLLLAIFALFAMKTVSADELAFEKGSFNEVLAKAKAENKIVMIDFITDWCIWCKHLDMRVYSNSDVVSYASTHQVNWKTDAEKEGKDLAKQYNVTGFPTLVFVDGDGKEIDKIVGFYPAKDFLEKIKLINERKSSLTYMQDYYNANKTDLKANLDLANKLIEAGKTEDAKQYLNYIITTDAGNSAGYTDDAELNLAMLPVEGKAADASITEVMALMEKYPGSNLEKDTKLFLSDKYFESKNDEKAYVVLSELIKANPDDDMVKFYMGQYYLGKARKVAGDSAATADQINQALKDVDMSVPYFTGGIFEASAANLKSTLYYKQGDIENSKKSIDRALELWADNKTYRKQYDKVYGNTK